MMPGILWKGVIIAAVVALLVVVAGCSRGSSNDNTGLKLPGTSGDSEQPPPLPEETADEGGTELPPAPPAIPSDGQESGLPMLG